uniref:RRM domain-containing protein n=1 Tax=Gasterosteus aculeatus aculeatus TaxID=481459 RepID=A0AAQ4R703_GASAC
MLSSPTVILQPYGLPVYPQTTTCYPSLVQGGPSQEAGPGSVDPALSQVYAPPPSYPPPGQGPPTSASRLPPLDFTSAHHSAEYPEHPQLRVYQGPQLEGAEALTSSNTEDVLAPLTSDPQSLSVSVSSGGGAGSGSDEEGSSKAQPKRLHVSNIPFRFRDPDLRQMFGQFGKILDVEIIFNERGSKGFGFVTFESASEADRAREKLNGTIVEGRKIEVNNATARVVTKKPQTPLVNADISTSGWKINPVMGAMYAPELYTGDVFFVKLLRYCDETRGVSPLFTLPTVCRHPFFSRQLPVSRANAHAGLPGLRAAWPRPSRLQHHPLRCGRTHRCARLPWDGISGGAVRSRGLWRLSGSLQNGSISIRCHGDLQRRIRTHLRHSCGSLPPLSWTNSDIRSRYDGQFVQRRI